MTPEEQVIEAAKAWHATGICDDATWGKEEWALAEAVRALTPLAPPLPPEPEDLAAVRITYTHSDASPDVAQRINIMAEGDSRWFIAGSKGRAWSWAELHSDPGGVVSVELLLPASSVVDVALAREAAEALLANASAWCHDRHGEFAEFEECKSPPCVGDRALLARLDAATGGAR